MCAKCCANRVDRDEFVWHFKTVGRVDLPFITTRVNGDILESTGSQPREITTSLQNTLCGETQYDRDLQIKNDKEIKKRVHDEPLGVLLKSKTEGGFVELNNLLKDDVALLKTISPLDLLEAGSPTYHECKMISDAAWKATFNGWKIWKTRKLLSKYTCDKYWTAIEIELEKEGNLKRKHPELDILGAPSSYDSTAPDADAFDAVIRDNGGTFPRLTKEMCSFCCGVYAIPGDEMTWKFRKEISLSLGVSAELSTSVYAPSGKRQENDQMSKEDVHRAQVEHAEEAANDRNIYLPLDNTKWHETAPLPGEFDRSKETYFCGDELDRTEQIKTETLSDASNAAIDTKNGLRQQGKQKKGAGSISQKIKGAIGLDTTATTATTAAAAASRSPSLDRSPSW
eukprot:g150.t1